MSGYDFRDACEAGDLDKVKGLIKSIDVNETDEFGYTGLHLAAEHGHLKVVEELMVKHHREYTFHLSVKIGSRM